MSNDSDNVWGRARNAALYAFWASVFVAAGCLWDYPVPLYGLSCEMQYQAHNIIAGAEKALGITMSDRQREALLDVRWSAHMGESRFYNATPLSADVGTVSAYAYSPSVHDQGKGVLPVIMFNNDNMPDSTHDGGRVIRHELVHHLVWVLFTSDSPEARAGHTWPFWADVMNNSYFSDTENPGRREEFSCVDSPFTGGCDPSWLRCWGDENDAGPPSDSGT